MPHPNVPNFLDQLHPKLHALRLAKEQARLAKLDARIDPRLGAQAEEAQRRLQEATIEWNTEYQVQLRERRLQKQVNA
jgi:hypothetical protein